MTWYQPLTLLEILFCGFFLLLYFLFILRTKHLARHFQQKAHLVWVKFGIRSVYFSLLILAILGPSFGAMKKEIRTVGKDILIAVDVSRSMDATDIAPSRMGRAKFVLADLIQQFNSDRIGLIIFSSEAFLHCPLTYDQQALHLYTQTLHTNLIPQSGTEFKPALDLGFSKLNQTSGEPDARAKIILVISDGENFSEGLANTLSDIRNGNIRLFTLGVGTSQGGKIPAPGGNKKGPDGKEVVTRLEPTVLREMAQEANGQYFEINEHINESEKLIRAINAVEGEVRQTTTIDTTANKYVYPLLLAFLLISLDVLLTFQPIRI